MTRSQKKCLRSIIFDKKERLEMGRNEFRSSGFSDDFFRRAVTRASLWESGKLPDCSDALQTAAIVGASTSVARLTNHVGSGSRGQCLHGARRMSLQTSLTVTGWNDDRVDSTGDGRSLISGGLADAVLRRILSTLFVKCFARSCSECGNWATVGALITLFILDHNCRASPAQLA